MIVTIKKQLLVLIFTTLSFVLIGCGEDTEVSSNEGAATGIWLAEVYAGPGQIPSMLEEEFATYSDCIAAAGKAAESGIFSCGVK